MADDTRQPNGQPKGAIQEDLSCEALTAHPENKPFEGQQWQVQNGKTMPYKPPENANMMPGGTQHTAGGETPEVNLYNALHVGQPITEIHKRPCVRDALLTGIGGGFATGGVRAIFGAPIFKACNWAVGTFCVGAGIMYQTCMYKRQAEKEGMMRAVEILNKKEMEKKAREQRKEAMREERRQAKEKEQDAQFAALNMAAPSGNNGKPWWKIW
ncbi:hypothetical protein CLAFUW4_12804 [Fulvia fulva]|uniref:Cytochrome c oxidase assembly protein COX20, mitochondrial n=1 Tax=Passalora fulva TaxID=5499 RepID=A0A9Q8UUW3_PASFU|nr:uncharacterized protein CLAFUR5_12672 [Fulvia fulva]KAK4611939.1 hypothetical protein CLAFUR4_12808 [Fulvia fulva]KAK4612897.1 hypothetical protein CLAFUR0_12814 [Fulvia fulva]UJO23318.1 hypothetical protein CLAFUR5_12672 [Fulvia fulva]WPV21283.1 hypothetical protein CLAFUW4_12804 [Fulvia fulva]WPV36432.1 hypothetical protein CLAFUW7_12812 [Fulvia fulva]